MTFSGQVDGRAGPGFGLVIPGGRVIVDTRRLTSRSGAPQIDAGDEIAVSGLLETSGDDPHRLEATAITLLAKRPPQGS